MKYNRGSRRWDFSGLHRFFTEVLAENEARHFFKATLPKMVELALRLPQLCTAVSCKGKVGRRDRAFSGIFQWNKLVLQPAFCSSACCLLADSEEFVRDAHATCTSHAYCSARRQHVGSTQEKLRQVNILSILINFMWKSVTVKE